MGDFGAYNDKLVEAIQNGKCEKWKRESYAPTPSILSESIFHNNNKWLHNSLHLLIVLESNLGQL